MGAWLVDTTAAWRARGVPHLQWQLTVWTRLLERAGIVALHAADPDAYFRRLEEVGFRGAETRLH
eukprot:11381957-Alexandrium_andersonii.AAC.1